MDVYIGTKIVRAEPQTKIDTILGSPLTDYLVEGYKVIYEDGYVSWSPKDVFERCYRKVSSQEAEMILEQAGFIRGTS